MVQIKWLANDVRPGHKSCIIMFILFTLLYPRFRVC